MRALSTWPSWRGVLERKPGSANVVQTALQRIGDPWADLVGAVDAAGSIQRIRWSCAGGNSMLFSWAMTPCGIAGARQAV
jgi:hypothetical protein